MRIVSVNAWGGGMYDALEPWVPAVGADVLCLQEVTRTAGHGGWATYRDDERHLPQRADLFADVKRLLPNHQGSFVASDAGPILVDGPDGEPVTRTQDFGLATYVDQGYPILGQLSEFVSGRFTEHERWPSNGRPRLAQGVRLLDRRRNRTVTIVHLHGLRDTAGKHDTPARRQQAEGLIGLVERLRQPDDLTVVCGDLNLLPDSETFDLLGAIGLVDLVGIADTRTSRYTKPIRHANYLLISDPEAVVGFEAPASPEVSDHRPLVLDL